MTLSTKILADEAPANAGHSAEPTGEVSAAQPIVIRGGAAYRSGPPHVTDAGQEIRHKEEHTTEFRTLIYREDDGAVDPGLASRYMLRASADLSLSIAKTPAVPVTQIHPDGEARTREANVELVIFHASEVNVTWPAGVIWGRVGYELAGDPAVLGEIQGPPENPRPAGTADRFTLRYNERTGEWWAVVTHAAVAAADPIAKDPDATDPEPDPNDPDEPGPGEDDTQPPENDYTDPETGEPLLPETPVIGTGYLVALHDGAISLSRNGGHTWKLYSAPGNAVAISPLVGEGVIVRTSIGQAYLSYDYDSWREMRFGRVDRTALPIVNGDFETGDLTGWSLMSGTSPLVLDTVQPPQQGGQFYLTSDLAAVDFEVVQSLDLPVMNSGTISLSARVYTELASTAEVEVRSGWDGQSYSLPDVQVPATVVNYNISSDSLALLRISGAGTDLIDRVEYAEGKIDLIAGYERFNFRFRDSEGVGHWQGGVSRTFPGSKTAQTELLGYTSLRFLQDTEIEITNAARGLSFTLYVPHGWRGPISYINDSYSYKIVESQSGSVSLSPDDFTPTGYTEVVTIPGTDRWRTVSLDIPASVGSPLEIILRGKDGPVYFDDVKAELARDVPGNVRAICRNFGSRRHIVATDTKIWAVYGGAESYLGEAPLLADLLAAEGDMIVAAAGASVAFSDDGGETFAIEQLESPVVQLFPLKPLPGSGIPVAAAVLEDGRMMRLAKGTGSNVEMLPLPEPGQVTPDPRRLRWLHTTPGGAVSLSDPTSLRDPATSWLDKKDMPTASTSLSRRIFATDSGRVFGYVDGSGDLFHSDDLEAAWKLGMALTAPVVTMVEIK
ncbi:hypothetical protein [Sagittula sp.]|uniref:hypothetical protein n=1 Tax=Sagittula sp. TaxID=2038081 RepID=UPI003516DAC7